MIEDKDLEFLNKRNKEFEETYKQREKSKFVDVRVEARVEKLLKLISSIPEDNVLHAYIGMTIYCIGAILFGPMVAIILVVIVAISKELYDSLHDDKHMVDGFDALATVIGAVPVMVLDMIRMW